jgi:hypothetical protein
MVPKYHPTPLSGGDRKALTNELEKSRGMTVMLARQSEELRAKGEALIREADKLLCGSWNEKMWSAGEPVDPSPTIDQAINGGFPWLEIECSRCRTPRDVDLCALRRPPTTCVHDPVRDLNGSSTYFVSMKSHFGHSKVRFSTSPGLGSRPASIMRFWHLGQRGRSIGQRFPSNGRSV